MKNDISKINELLDKLETEFNSLSQVLVALSGGVDSCLIVYLARKFLGKQNTYAIISNSDSLKEKDFNIAIKFCQTHDINYKVIITNELENENYASNPQNRCYFCKNELYSEMNNLVKSEFIGFKILNGNNYSDLGDYRPGLLAADEHGAVSPFINCEISKDQIRKIANHYDLVVWNKPASPCLSSRFPYGESINKEKLVRVEQAEGILNNFGFEEVRVRSYENLAKIEVPVSQIKRLSNLHPQIEDEFHSIGFTKVEIDNEGFMSGKMNRVINEL